MTTPQTVINDFTRYVQTNNYPTFFDYSHINTFNSKYTGEKQILPHKYHEKSRAFVGSRILDLHAL